mmetsp:Transcript_12114/g.18058  ORF Transcript_12114/g.18058 Transcript_12114/m.18058 type:complete len:388 (+) Transcript_12114:78-1241(+)
MEASKTARLQLILREGSAQKRIALQNVDLGMTLREFKKLVESKTKIPTHFQLLEVMDRSAGLRPRFRKIDMSLSSAVLKAHGISNGYSLQLKDLRKESGNATIRQGKGWEYPKTVSINDRIEKKAMPRDNSCLFHSIAFLSDAEGVNAEAKATNMRMLAAQTIGSNPRVFDTAFLGMPNGNYVNVVMDPNQWGGGIEISVFSRHFSMEIVAFDFHFLREDWFGQGQDYKKRAFLVYSGDHYDVLTSTDKKGATQKLFSTKDVKAWEKARVLIQSLHHNAAKGGRCKLQKKWRKEIRKVKPAAKSYTAGSNRLGNAPIAKPEEKKKEENKEDTKKPEDNTRSKAPPISSPDTKQNGSYGFSTSNSTVKADQKLKNESKTIAKKRNSRC